MKHRQTAVLLATGLGFALAGQARAQDTVLLYGLIDEGFLFNANAKSARQYQLASGNLQGSRFGMRGAHDLGEAGAPFSFSRMASTSTTVRWARAAASSAERPLSA
ncbi:hypothetical protein M3I54_38375 [Paraburkholderia sp. CNPSo 3274]|uniref:hypothetical protein n=1 Tax=Paraburkholderia sp. CNPSo 3274 TaxID=2940932 RepID=UPI0020B89656|nr:hypothetical protein [Paraburkholderia sp. CNPSo 3274]MCP3712708.1 hypothetical protein [Paraburkholderia sp. CNPSo 3274]